MLKVYTLIGLSLTAPLHAKTYYVPEERPFPCISEVACECANEMDPTLVKVSVDYFDDIGTKYHWTGQLHSRENYSDCDTAMKDKFPYPFFKRCEVEDSTTF